jgi:EpsI family protein
MHSNSDHKSVIAAAVLASFIMLIFGLAHHLLVARQAAPVNETRLDPAMLRDLPSKIAGWTGEDVPLDEATVDATGTDAYISRRYRRDDGSESVTLYIACGANVNEVMAHRPTGCYRSAGWQITGHRSMEVRAVDGTTIPCFLYEFRRNGADGERLAVLHYCFANGEYFNEVMQVLARGWRQLRAIGWAAQVEIVASDLGLTDGSAARWVRAFADDSSSEVNRMFEIIGKARLPNEVGGPVAGE